MLKKRVIATIVVKDGIVVQSINFKKYLPVGKPHIAIEYLNIWGIDEIIFLDISATKNSKGPNYDLIKKCSEKCFVPLTVGGGISNLSQIDKLMSCGADKISLNSSSRSSPQLISDAANKFGNQSVVLSLDCVKINKKYKVFDYLSRKALDLSPIDSIENSLNNGIGEVFVNSVDRDGSYQGFDIELIKLFDKINIPIICSGGAKNADDFTKVFGQTNVSGAAAANFFHFSEHNVIITKCGISKSSDIRIETNSKYSKDNFNEFYRLRKKPDSELSKLLNIRIEKEII
ncbi:HisA/HisF-related TIM barrel protein [Akkermansiaceae bacterium]|nr:HisA/HisF-related TIM barrel protein [Akkermansiaceae bacterium]